MLRRPLHPTSRKSPRRSNHGFSLLELLIVVAIILVIAAIAIPNFLRSRMAANEASAVQNLRNITTAQVVYSTTYGIGFSAQLSFLGPTPGNPLATSPTNAGLIDDVLAAGAKSGYSFTYNATDADGDGNNEAFAITAVPSNPGSTGQRRFFTDQSGVVRANIAGPADVSSTPIG